MPRNIDLNRLRYYASFALIGIGVAMLVYVGLRQLDSGTEAGQTIPEDALIKGLPQDCPPDWRYIDNVDQRYTICLPLNLVFYDGNGILPLEYATEDDWARINANFVMVNDAGLALSPVEVQHAAIAPISLSVEVLGPAISFEGCDPRAETPDADGVVVCSDTFRFEEEQSVFEPDAPIHRFKALIPTQKGESVNEVFSLHLSIVSLSQDWQLQEPLFRELLPTLRPY
ncbi:MAG: hypothetical protein GEU75_03885 [Dehalococcoidia bacterium]|nr:hypothetical protein [Dehalococcoidia bacterium]